MFVVIFFKTIIRFGFCDILNNQGLNKCYQPRPSARLITLSSTSIIPDITKTSSNNCLLLSTNQNATFITENAVAALNFSFVLLPSPQFARKLQHKDVRRPASLHFRFSRKLIHHVKMLFYGALNGNYSNVCAFSLVALILYVSCIGS